MVTVGMHVTVVRPESLNPEEPGWFRDRPHSFTGIVIRVGPYVEVKIDEECDPLRHFDKDTWVCSPRWIEPTGGPW